MRAQKQLEALLKQRLGSLDTLHSALLRVEQSAGDVEARNLFDWARLRTYNAPTDHEVL